ncbi:MAG: hypothetical protein LBI72_11665 [Flavobacteriaceae bacterium]|jgi:hypothetical protein|nr:hypothetical protein [Flavobacteriaceae bacterium]
MKKVLESELLSLAHRILQMKSKEVNDLYDVSKELYEKLLILKFYEEKLAVNLIEDVSEEKLHSALEKTVENKVVATEVVEERMQMPVDLTEEDYPLVVDTAKEVIVEPNTIALEHVEKIATVVEEELHVQQEVMFDTPFDEKVFEENTIGDQELIDLLDEHEAAINGSVVQQIEQEVEVNEPLIAETQPTSMQWMDSIKEEKEVVQVEDSKNTTENFQLNTEELAKDDPFFGFDYTDVEFVKVNDVPKEVAVDISKDFEPLVQTEKVETKSQNTLFNMDSIPVKEPVAVKTKSLNDVFNSTIVVGLNDRIAFEKYLFEGSSEDFNRVLSQLNTVASYDEAISFVEHLVKPEYNNWEGKNEYEERFMAIVEKRFA